MKNSEYKVHTLVGADKGIKTVKGARYVLKDKRLKGYQFFAYNTGFEWRLIEQTTGIMAVGAFIRKDLESVLIQKITNLCGFDGFQALIDEHEIICDNQTSEPCQIKK